MLRALNNWRVHRVPVKSDDLKLIAEALEGSEKAYTSLTTKYWGRVFSFLRKKVNDNATAEDLTQDTFAAAFRYLHTFRGDSSLYTWLCTIALNKASKRPFNSFKIEVEGVTSATPESLLMSKQAFMLVVDIIEELPEKQQRAFYMKHTQGMCYEDIGVALKCGARHAKNLVYMAKKNIRSRYDERGEL